MGLAAGGWGMSEEVFHLCQAIGQTRPELLPSAAAAAAAAAAATTTTTAI